MTTTYYQTKDTLFTKQQERKLQMQHEINFIFNELYHLPEFLPSYDYPLQPEAQELQTALQLLHRRLNFEAKTTKRTEDALNTARELFIAVNVALSPDNSQKQRLKAIKEFEENTRCNTYSQETINLLSKIITTLVVLTVSLGTAAAAVSYWPLSSAVLPVSGALMRDGIPQQVAKLNNCVSSFFKLAQDKERDDLSDSLYRYQRLF